MKKIEKVFMEKGDFYIIMKGKDIFENVNLLKVMLDRRVEELYFLKLKYCSKKLIAPNLIKIKLRKNLQLCPAGAPKKFTKEEIENIKKRLKIKEN